MVDTDLFRNVRIDERGARDLRLQMPAMFIFTILRCLNEFESSLKALYPQYSHVEFL